MEWEPIPGEKPVRVQLLKRSPGLERIEQHHISLQQNQGYLRMLPANETSRWASRTLIVPKPGEFPKLGQGGFGRLVGDFRVSNLAVVKKASVMTPMWGMLPELAAALILSLIDA